MVQEKTDITAFSVQRLFSTTLSHIASIFVRLQILPQPWNAIGGVFEQSVPAVDLRGRSNSGWMLPRRIFAGQAKGRVQYFPLRMPVAVGQEAALFVYIDPGMGTHTELHSWGAAHRALWEELRESGRPSSWLRVPGSSTCWTAPSVFFSPGTAGPSATPRQKSSPSSWPSITPIGTPWNLMVASMPP